MLLLFYLIDRLLALLYDYVALVVLLIAISSVFIIVTNVIVVDSVVTVAAVVGVTAFPAAFIIIAICSFP